MEVKRISEVLGRPLTIREVTAGYLKDSDDGCSTDKVFGLDGKLNLRPAYQRNSVYDDKKRKAVIQTILEKCPLGLMYWVDNGDGTYEVLDGQQRLLSICQFIAGEFEVASNKFPNEESLDFANIQTNFPEIAEDILDKYELDVYVCNGTNDEKLKWFNRINTAGEPLNKQELLNAAHTGKWLASAKGYFSNENGRGVNLADKNPENNQEEPLLNGAWNRQEYLETAIEWAANVEFSNEDNPLNSYMNAYAQNEDARDLWLYFSRVIEWVRSKFVTYDKALRGMDWGAIYEAYQNDEYVGNIISKSSSEIQEEICNLMEDEEVTASMRGIYMYIITGEYKHLSLRKFDDKMAKIVYESQRHHCPKCDAEGNHKEYAFKEMEADHIVPWSQGGKTTLDNCMMLCKHHNRVKSDD